MLSHLRVTKILSWACCFALALTLGAAPASAKTKHKSGKHTTTIVGKSTKKGKKGKSARKPRGQQAIDGDRARQIQTALIREHYMDGEPSGYFDQQTRNALAKFQGDNGWQTKVVPDSRALIKLGLGPDMSKAINPEALNRPEVARDQVPGGAEGKQ